VSAALSGCMRCSIPLNAPPYDPAQWGWGPQDRYCVTRSYYGFAKDYPGVHPYYVVPPGAPACPTSAGPMCPGCGPTVVPIAAAQMPMAAPTVVNPSPVSPTPVGPSPTGPSPVGPRAAGPSAIAF
jgi:hypothetical protein